jgi:transcriptional regulator with XRE-family HTH domain
METVSPLRAPSMTHQVAERINKMSQHDDNIVCRQRAMQERVFRLAARDHGLTLKAISLDSGLGYTTVQSYAKGEAVMSIASLFKLIGVLPDELLSLLLPDGRLIVQAPAELDHDQIAEACHDYLATKERAHHPESPAGREIADCEDGTLRDKFAVVAGGKA